MRTIRNGRRKTSLGHDQRREDLPTFIGQAATDELLRRGGMACQAEPKVNQTLRLDPDVLNAYMRQGSGWQALVNRYALEASQAGHSPTAAADC
jgi:uncharacterized protein (DUF4415 family)